MASLLGDLFCFFRNRTALLGFSALCFLVVESSGRERMNEVTFGFASGFGIKARFQNPAMPNPTFPGTPSSVAGRTIYKYNDGYVDGGGNSGNSWVNSFNSVERTYYGTSSWSYDDAAQYLGNGVMVFTHDQSTLTNNTLQSDRAGYVPGIHVGYRRELRSDDSISLGFLAGLEMHRIDIGSSSSFNGTYYQTKDYYLLKDATVPGAPYEGTAGGPDISNLYGRRDVTTGYVDTYRSNTIEGNLFVLQSGMDFRYYFEEGMSLQVAVGIIYAPFLYDYSFRDSLQMAANSPEIVYAIGNSSEFEGIFGSFFNVKWAFAFTENWGGYIGLRHLHMDKVKLEYEEDRWTELNFRNSIFVDTGVTYIW